MEGREGGPTRTLGESLQVLSTPALLPVAGHPRPRHYGAPKSAEPAHASTLSKGLGILLTFEGQ